MTEDDLKTSALSQALQLFISELGSHLAQFRKALERSEPFTEDEYYELCAKEAKHFEHGFHTVKGGAGFLGLPAVAELAKQGEQLFKRGEVTVGKPELRPALERIIGELERHLQTLANR